MKKYKTWLREIGIVLCAFFSLAFPTGFWRWSSRYAACFRMKNKWLLRVPLHFHSIPSQGHLLAPSRVGGISCISYFRMKRMNDFDSLRGSTEWRDTDAKKYPRNSTIHSPSGIQLLNSQRGNSVSNSCKRNELRIHKNNVAAMGGFPFSHFFVYNFLLKVLFSSEQY